MKNPAGDATGTVSQPHSFGHGKNRDALYLDNGGDSGTGYLALFSWLVDGLPFALQLRGPFNFDVRPGFPPSPGLCAA